MMGNGEEYLQQPEKEQKRPDLLTILCILTFIGSGLGSFVFLMVTLSYEETMAIMEEQAKDFPGMKTFLTAKPGFFIMGSILYLTSLTGAIQMWKLRKIGFHMYVVSQLLIIILPLVYIKQFGFPYIDVIITSIFVFLYSRNLKFMH